MKIATSSASPSGRASAIENSARENFQDFVNPGRIGEKASLRRARARARILARKTFRNAPAAPLFFFFSARRSLLRPTLPGCSLNNRGKIIETEGSIYDRTVASVRESRAKNYGAAPPAAHTPAVPRATELGFIKVERRIFH